MKKIVGISIAILSCSLSFSQENTQMQNKNGIDIMPVKGEFAVGLNAAPFLTFAGNMFGYNSSNNGLGNNKFLSDYFGSNTIYGKYMLTDNNALRANFSLLDQKYTYKYNVFNDAINSPDSLLMDTRYNMYSEFNMGLGYEFRRGKTRLKGIYGGEVVFMRSQTKTRYEYGNALGSSNQTPTSSFNANGSYMGTHGAQVAERITSNIQSRTLGIGLRAFVGVEYYFTPKICIGTEFGQALSYTANKKSTVTTESFDPNATNADGTTGGVITDINETAGRRYFGLNTDNFNGSIYLMFYF